MHSQGIQGAAHATPTFIQHMRVDHRGTDIRMPQPEMDDAIAGLERRADSVYYPV